VEADQAIEKTASFFGPYPYGLLFHNGGHHVKRDSGVGLFGVERDGYRQRRPAASRTGDVQTAGKRLNTVLEPD
jgi:hypothetical protein